MATVEVFDPLTTVPESLGRFQQFRRLDGVECGVTSSDMDLQPLQFLQSLTVLLTSKEKIPVKNQFCRKNLDVTSQHSMSAGLRVEMSLLLGTGGVLPGHTCHTSLLLLSCLVASSRKSRLLKESKRCCRASWRNRRVFRSSFIFGKMLVRR